MNAWLWIAACTSGPLEAVPIDGGTWQLRDALREELEAFERWTGEGRVHVSKVSIRDLGDSRGRWAPIGRRISIHEQLEPDLARTVLRHELCHALDEAEGHFYADHPALYARLAEGLFASPLVVDDPRCGTGRCRKEEAYAVFCERGPLLAQAVAASCPDDPADAGAVMTHLSAEVWTAWEPAAISPGPVMASLPVGGWPTFAEGWGTTTPGVALLRWEQADGAARDRFVELRTGADATHLLDRDFGLVSPSTSPGGAPYHAKVGHVVGWAHGPAAGRMHIDLAHLGFASRDVYSDGTAWQIVGDGCPAQTHPFAHDDGIYVLDLGEDTIDWRML